MLLELFLIQLVIDIFAFIPSALVSVKTVLLAIVMVNLRLDIVYISFHPMVILSRQSYCLICCISRPVQETLTVIFDLDIIQGYYRDLWLKRDTAHRGFFFSLSYSPSKYHGVFGAHGVVVLIVMLC